MLVATAILLTVVAWAPNLKRYTTFLQNETPPTSKTVLKATLKGDEMSSMGKSWLEVRLSNTVDRGSAQLEVVPNRRFEAV